MHKLFHCTTLVACITCTVFAAPARADDKADALLKEVVARYKAIKSFSATLTTSAIISTTEAGGSTKVYGTETLKLQKPNLGCIVPITLIEAEGAGVAHSVPDPITISNGITLWTFKKAANTYDTSRVDPNGTLLALNSSAIGLFYVPEVFLSDATDVLRDLAPITTSSQVIGMEKVNGLSCQVVEMTLNIMPKPFTQPLTRKMRFYIGPGKLVYRIVQDSTIPKGGSIHMEETLTDIRINPNLPALDFTFIPPSGARDTTQDKASK